MTRINPVIYNNNKLRQIGLNLNAIKNIIIVLTLCALTVTIAWFSVFNLLGLFIDTAPYSVGNSFYLTEIMLTFLLYALGSYLAIRYTTFHPLVAALPVGMTGLVFYTIELGGLDCVGVCGMPLWYDVVSFFKHLFASTLIIFLSLIKKRSSKTSPINSVSVEKPYWFSKLPSVKAIFITFCLLSAGVFIGGVMIIVELSENKKTVVLYSKVLKEQRKVSVFLPSGYSDNDKSYDVLYTLDGENPQHNYFAAATAKILTSLGGIPEIIVVAIDGQGKRQRDFRRKGAVAVDGRETSGEAAQFQLFLEDELIPNIASKFRIGNRKFLAGHSYGALYTAYSFTEHREVFDGYFCFSPSFEDSNSSVMSFKNGLNEQVSDKKFIYLNLGLEGGKMRELFKQVESFVVNNQLDNLDSKVSYYSLPHALVMIPGYFEALSRFYKNNENRTH